MTEKEALQQKLAMAEKELRQLQNRQKILLNKPVREKLNKLNPKKRAAFAEQHRAELTLFDASRRFLNELAASGEKITPKAW